MAARKLSDSQALKPKVCPVPMCVGGIVWNDEAPIGECPICKGAGIVPLSIWLRYTFNVAKGGSDGGNDGGV